MSQEADLEGLDSTWVYLKLVTNVLIFMEKQHVTNIDEEKKKRKTSFDHFDPVSPREDRILIRLVKLTYAVIFECKLFEHAE